MRKITFEPIIESRKNNKWKNKNKI